MGKFKFGVSLREIGSRDAWIAKCRRAEELGYDVITVPDHLGTGRFAPFPVLAMAAAVTERPRLGTLVSNVPFYNLALFAREASTTAALLDGRLDLGLGAGHMKSEFDTAGLPWHKASERIGYLEDSLGYLRKHFEDEGIPTPPLLIAGNSDGVLDLAAEHADIVGFAGLRQQPGKPPGTFKLDNAEAVDERVAYFRGKTSRDLEHNMLVQHVEITDDREQAAEAWHELTERTAVADARELLDAPQLLLGTVEEIAGQLEQRRERYGFSYITVFEAALETFAPVIRDLQ
ncbi:TIGR03621 family F420-dependent LLM class oxidoreductase [Amycolatopsis vancoresmycina]|uniref:Coenzyme F420-dependent N5,N10-methenyltetrahydromethanopterin reductase n=1 Tax=Amycolatopsis vancoresmycina DSM 44592 TaxID=1292037 RepID=R1I148_9PSEU|nr:TIGR03621 family F420-dependent LLM class oxidoreductase [Amycolatopsis vancoresmycina]EOD69505.1 coenzyme F420-dependent N5,N10-methenyltetrahydromethanopterin reductase [Amycolatopsis vancoresmycina DSM 44592]